MQNQETSLPEGHVEDQKPTEESDNKTDNKVESDEKSGQDPIQILEQKLQESNDKYLRLYSDFDNFRKRSLKEKSDIIKTASEDAFKSILPVLDDFERAIKANETITDSESIKEGMLLIYTKLKNNATNKGLLAFESIGQSFDPDLMEAITHIPAGSESEKGKVVDEVEKGYKLGDKVIRFAKVIVAQ